MTLSYRLLLASFFVMTLLPSQAASIAIRHTVMVEPYLWQFISIDQQTGDYVDEVGSKNIDVDGDGQDDIGFTNGFTEEISVLASFDTQILVRRIGGPTDLGGVAARFESGSIIGSESISSLYHFTAISPYFPYHHPELIDLGEYAGNFDPPLPFDVLVTGSTSGWSSDLWKGNSGHLGFRILKEDGWHYGWVYVEKDPTLTVIGGNVMSYAYETEPNRALIAGAIPEPSATALFSVSLGSLLLRRRRHSK